MSMASETQNAKPKVATNLSQNPAYSARMKNQPEAFPLQKVVPRNEFLIQDPQAGISLINTKEPQSLILLRKRSWTTDTSRISNNDQQLQGNSNPQSSNFDEESSSCDDMLISDTDSNSLLSLHNSMLSILKENRLIHPPKRRLMVPSGHVVTATISEEANQITGQIQTVNNTKDIRTPTAFTSPSNTPVSVTDEEIDMGAVAQQLLPLPSPSASPVYAKDDEDETTLQRAIFTAPQNQQEVFLMIYGMLQFLSEKNRNHLIFKLLQNVNRLNLLLFNNLIHDSLRRDLLLNLPLEITYQILCLLDYKTICLLLRVCQNWNRIINSTDIWTHKLKKEGLISDDAEIDRELKNPDLTLWSPNPHLPNLNMTQLLFKKRRTILNRWMNPNYEPKRMSVLGHGSHVVTSLQVDEDKIVTGVEDKLINIYLTKTGELIRILKGHDGGVWAMKYTGNTLVSGLTDRTVRVWNIKTGRCTHVFRGHTLTVRCLDIIHPAKIGVDDNGKDIIFPETPLLVTGSRDHDLRVWRLPLVDENEDEDNDFAEPIEIEGRTDSENPYLITVLMGHTHSVRLVSTYGNIVLSGSYDNTVRVWDLLDGGRCKHVLSGHQEKIYLTALDFKNKRCYLGSMDSTIKVWDIEKGKIVNTLLGHTSLVGLLELLDEYLVSAAADMTLRVWDPKTCRNTSKLEGHTAAITCFQHDNLRIVSGSEKMLKLWDIKTGKFVRDLLADISGGIWQVRFDFNRCVAAAQRNINNVDETFIEIVDFSTPPQYET